MTHDTLNINLDALLSNYLVQLQHLLDGISLLETGSAVVTEEEVAESRHFMSFYPAQNARLTFPEAVAFANDWLLKSFLRDSIEITGLFLDDCLTVCDLIDISGKEEMLRSDVNQILDVQSSKNHKLNFPNKVSMLEKKIGITSPYGNHILSINRARACVVHRLGIVSAQDVDQQNELTIKWLHYQMIARENDTGNEQIIKESGTIVKGGSTIAIHWIDHVKVFQLGERISLTPLELYACIVTFWRFGNSIDQAIKNYAISLGLLPSEENPGK
ncbi:MAG: hypothetical protein WC762_02445 [Methylobacter sp.]|jgi:hypothetical protein